MAKTTKDSLYEQIRNAIVFGEIAPGTSINERELAARYHVSRTPVREILIRLAHQKLVTIEPNRGATVSPVDYATARAIYEVRLPLERTIAALACERASPVDIEELRRMVATLKGLRRARDVAGFIRSDRAFHARLAAIAANPLLTQLLEDLHTSNLRFWYINRETVYSGLLDVENLEGVAEAVAARDARAAADAMASHVLAYVEASERYFRRSITALDQAFRGEQPPSLDAGRRRA